MSWRPYKGFLIASSLLWGRILRGLESEIAAYCGTTHALGVSSVRYRCVNFGLDGLRIGPGDEVITTPFTFFATAGSISRVGRSGFVDIDPDTYNIDPTKIEAAITPKTKAIMPVHLFGQVADMDAIMAIANQNNLCVIEDAAQAIGATYNGKLAGSIDDIGVFRFFPSKNLGACGDGGYGYHKQS